ncbi:MAG: hypothetical protein FJ241_10990 [Nitrospira sp.]|nr:hypothetical protein [Nitrospira sp.]
MKHNEKIDELIHKELIPMQQMFISYEQLSFNPSYRFNGKIFHKCALKIQQIIDLTRELAKEVEEKC